MTTEWKWSDGKSYFKSPRTVVEKVDTNKEKIDDPVGTHAINQSLDGFDFEPMFSRNDNPSGNRREDLDNKMSNRELIFQRGTNPFLQTDYVKDVVARDIFLKPKNTTFEKSKEEIKEME
jgi:hypothetical protein